MISPSPYLFFIRCNKYYLYKFIFGGKFILAVLNIFAKPAQIKLCQELITINVLKAAYIWNYKCAKIKMRKQTFVQPPNFDTADFKCFSVINLYLRSSLLAKTYMQYKFNDSNTNGSFTLADLFLSP